MAGAGKGGKSGGGMPVLGKGARGAGGGPGLGLWLGLAALVIVLDQLTKTLVIVSFTLGDSLRVTDFFNLVRVHNTGAAFSFLAGASGWQRWFFVGLGLAASAFIVWMIRSHPSQKLFCFAVTMIMGGALGNVIDRLLHGHVVDFLQFRLAILEPLFPGGYFPSFNVADSAITLGAACVILDEILRVRRSR
jgi:signal peptidase II